MCFFFRFGLFGKDWFVDAVSRGLIVETPKNDEGGGKLHDDDADDSNYCFDILYYLQVV